MIITEIVNNLKHTFSNSNHYIIQIPTGIEYSEAYDVLDSNFTYIESDTKKPSIEEAVE